MITVPAPPSKSQTHRALVLAALATGPSEVRSPLESDDTMHTRACLEALGARFTPSGDGYAVTPIPEDRPAAAVDLFVGESGTTCRLVTALAAALPGSARIHGAGRMHARPIAPLAEALARLGVEVRFEEAPGCPPLTLVSRGWQASHTVLDASASSQYLSALLLAALRSPGGLTVDLVGERVASWPYAALTLQAMAEAGIPVTLSRRHGPGFLPCRPEDVPALPARQVRCCVPAGARPQGGTFQVEGDWSSASYLIAAGILGAVPVTVTGLRPDSLQADRHLVAILQRMGGHIEVRADGVTAWPSRLTGATLPMGACPDLVPTVAMLAAAAQGETRITEAAHLRLKESDRIAAVVDGLTRLGVAAHATADGMVIQGGLPARGPVALATCGDHRLAMSLSLAELAGAQPVLDQPGCVAKSFPGFWTAWATIRAANQEARRG